KRDELSTCGSPPDITCRSCPTFIGHSQISDAGLSRNRLHVLSGGIVHHNHLSYARHFVQCCQAVLEVIKIVIIRNNDAQTLCRRWRDRQQRCGDFREQSIGGNCQKRGSLAEIKSKKANRLNCALSRTQESADEQSSNPTSRFLIPVDAMLSNDLQSLFSTAMPRVANICMAEATRLHK